MSQQLLAEEIGITFQQVQKYEKGVNRISIGTLIKIANALKVQVPALLPQYDGEHGAGSLNVDGGNIPELAALTANLNAEGWALLLAHAKTLANSPTLTVRTPQTRKTKD